MNQFIVLLIKNNRKPQTISRCSKLRAAMLHMEFLKERHKQWDYRIYLFDGFNTELYRCKPYETRNNLEYTVDYDDFFSFNSVDFKE